MAGLTGFLLLAFWIGRYGVNLPWMDEWEVLPLLQHYQAGKVSFEEMMVLHGDHRLFVPRLVFLGMRTVLGEWDITAQMLFSAAVAGTIVGTLVWSLRRLAVSAPAALLAALVLVSPVQWENILWGFQVQFYLMVCFTLSAVLLVAMTDRTGWRGFAGLAALCFASSFTMGSGIFSWAIVVACLGVRSGAQWKQLVGFGDHGFKPGPLSVFLLAGVLCVAGFFYGYIESATQLKPARIATILRWCVRAMSYPLLEQPSAWRYILVAGQWLTIGVAFAGWWWRRADRTERAKLVLMVGLLGFLLLNIVVTGYRRGGYIEAGPAGGIPPRYATIFLWSAAIFVIAAAELLGRIRRTSSWHWVQSGALLVLTTTLLAAHGEAGREAIAKMAEVHGYIRFTSVSVINYLRDGSPRRHISGELPMRADRLEELLNDPAMVAELPKWLQARGGDLPAQTTGEAWARDGAFFAGTRPDRRLVWGSWNSNDDLVGRLETDPIPVTRPILILPVTGYPSREANRLAVVSEDGRREKVYHGPFAHEGWLEWRVDVSEFVGSRIRIVAVDGTKGPGGWLGFGVPWQRGRLLNGMDAALAWYDAQGGRLLMIAIVGCIVLLLLRKRGPAVDGLRPPGELH